MEVEPFSSESKTGYQYFEVSELTGLIKARLEPCFQKVCVQGEITNYRPPGPSGHLYFSVKDAGACLSVAIFGWGSRVKPHFALKEGMRVKIRGKLSVYALRGSYQLIADFIDPDGEGALQVAFEQLKKRLSQEGLFDAQHKQKIPAYPKRIVVITSPQGAVLQDILQILRRRAPLIEILVIPSLVQGSEAVAQLVAGIEQAHQLAEVDLIILARGGGSTEDLWCFNDEKLVRAIFQSKLPVLSGVGHETDVTLCDFVSDLRAPTPSAAAEIISSSWIEGFQRVLDLKIRLHSLTQRELERQKLVLKTWSSRVISPADRLKDQIQRLDDLFLRLERSVSYCLEKAQRRLGVEKVQLQALSPLQVLKRGYTYVTAEEPSPHIVSSQQSTHPGKKIQIQFHDGKVMAQVL